MRFVPFLILALLVAAQAQAAHTVTLTIQDTKNTGTVTYNIYKATGLCSGSPVFSKLATGVASLTYVDQNVAVGNYCYEVTASQNGAESGPSPTAVGNVLPFTPVITQVLVN